MNSFQHWFGAELTRSAKVRRWGIQSLGAIALLLMAAWPAAAHHPFGNEAPANAVQGFLSGLGHPIIGVDHLAFVIAIGLLAATTLRGIVLPVAFVGGTVLGTLIHLMEWNLPLPEVVVSASVLGFGLVLALGRQVPWGGLVGLGAIAGLFHGYAYGEAVIGAEMTPILAYLAGFATIQLGIAIAARQAGRTLLKAEGDRPSLALRFAGFALAGAGAAFLSSVVLG